MEAAGSVAVSTCSSLLCLVSLHHFLFVAAVLSAVLVTGLIPSVPVPSQVSCALHALTAFYFRISLRTLWTEQQVGLLGF